MTTKRVNYPAAIELIRDPRLFLAFGFGSGLSRIMPGTCGTIAALPVYYLMSGLPWLVYGLLTLIAFFVGNHLCGYAAKKLNVHDHGGIVWDEFVGMWITLFLIPVYWHTVLIGFILFRIFDMAKPWPISLADKHVHGGFGIMFDDVLAGIAAWVCLHGLYYFVDVASLLERII